MNPIARRPVSGNSLRVMAEWFYGEDGRQCGPVDDARLHALIAEGAIRSETLLWRAGQRDWQTLGQLRATGGLAATPGPVQEMPWEGGPAGTSGLATASLVCGIAGFLCGLAAVPAVICGHMALSDISRSPVPVGGRGMALAGLILGYLELLLMVLFAVVRWNTGFAT